MTAIYLDLDGTLVRYRQSFEEIFRVACESCGVSFEIDAHDYYTERFFEHFLAFADDPYLAASIDICNEFEYSTDPRAFTDAYVEAERAATTVPEGVVDALDTLAEDHRLGVISNGVGYVQRGKLAEHDLESRFDAVVVSHDAGALKPDPAIFEAAKERLPADRYVYVGDNVADDVEPAAEAGFGTVHVYDGRPGGDADVNGSTDEHGAGDTDTSHRACPADLDIAPTEFHRIGDVL